MIVAFELLSLATLIGVIDVLYFHLYRFRLYDQPGSNAEELTHLLRAAIFAAVVALIAFSNGSPLARQALLVLAGLDLVNNIADVTLEKRSRAPLGGLPTAEYLLHIVGTFLVGLAVAAVWFQSSPAGFVPLPDEPWYQWRAMGTVVGGVGLLGIEAWLWIRSLARRRLTEVVAG